MQLFVRGLDGSSSSVMLDSTHNLLQLHHCVQVRHHHGKSLYAPIYKQHASRKGPLHLLCCVL
jgi:hypothetical protein